MRVSFPAPSIKKWISEKRSIFFRPKKSFSLILSATSSENIQIQPQLVALHNGRFRKQSAPIPAESAWLTDSTIYKVLQENRVVTATPSECQSGDG